MRRSYVFEDVDIDCGWTATVEVIDEGELGTFLGKWMAVDANATECRSDGDPADCIVRSRVVKWVESIGPHVALLHAGNRKRARGGKAIMAAIELTSEFTDKPVAKVRPRPVIELANSLMADVYGSKADAAIAGQTREMLHRSMAGESPYRTGNLGCDGTNNDSPDADWRDAANGGC